MTAYPTHQLCYCNGRIYPSKKNDVHELKNEHPEEDLLCDPPYFLPGCSLRGCSHGMQYTVDIEIVEAT